MGRAVTVELDDVSITAAEEAGIDLSELLEQALRRRLPRLQASDPSEASRSWYEENKASVDGYNSMIEADGFLFSDGVRMF
jgi:post-segregation antitoxin (ccd killing protein)